MFKNCLIILLFLFCPLHLVAQTIAITEEGKKVILKSDKTWEYLSEKPTENKSASSDTKIVGDDIKTLAKFIPTIKSKLEKSEFETEEQYLRRLELFFSETKFNEKPLEDTVLIFSPELRYDAENQEFSVLPYLMQSSGVRIDFVAWSYGRFSSNKIKFLQFKISTEKAQKEKPDIALAVYGVPVGYEEILNTIKFIPAKYVFFNKNTNEIYSEISEADETDNSNATSNTPLNYNGPVRVRGYFRRDGTYVRSHTRNRPKN